MIASTNTDYASITTFWNGNGTSNKLGWRGFGSGMFTGKAYVSMDVLPPPTGACWVRLQYSSDGTSSTPIYSTVASYDQPVAVGATGTTTPFSRYEPVVIDLVNVDLSKVYIALEQLVGNGIASIETRIYDMVLVADATTSDSTLKQTAPDGIETGFYMIEDSGFNDHYLEAKCTQETSGAISVSFYTQTGVLS